MYKNKYRIESARVQGWDYASTGYYFVTICTRYRECFFGEIADGQIQLSRAGEIAKEELEKTIKIHDNIRVEEHIIMPNHLHIVISIEDKKQTLSNIICAFKAAATKRIREEYCTKFAWQSRFYDEIIRDKKALQNIKEYIINNPIKWQSDKNNPK